MDAYPASVLPSALGRLTRETDMFLATVDSLSEEELRGPSTCEGWTAAHVVTHVARNADALGNLVRWAVTGVETPAYSSKEDRDRDIDDGARRPAPVIKEDVREACGRLTTDIAQLAGDLAAEEVRIFSGTVPARALVAVRTTEVILHHDDLGTVWGLEEADPDAQLDALEEPFRRLHARNDVPPVIVRTTEKDAWSIGEGGVVVSGERAAVLAWLARGETDGVTADGHLPRLSPFA